MFYLQISANFFPLYLKAKTLFNIFLSDETLTDFTVFFQSFCRAGLLLGEHRATGGLRLRASGEGVGR